MAEKRTTPQVRFAGFADEWETYRLEEVAEEIIRNDPNSTAPVMMITAENGFIRQSERYSFDNSGQSLKKYILLKKNELAYNHGASKLRPFGSCFALIEEEARIPFVYHCFAVGNNNSQFVSMELNGSKVEEQLRKLVTSGARMDGLLNISYEDYSGVLIHLPDIEEQDKLANYFLHLNDLIAKEQAKNEKLLNFKKSMLEKVFPKDGADVPEIRFKGFSGVWTKGKLSDIANKVIEKNTNHVFNETFTNSAEFGVISQRDFFDHDISSKDNIGGYYVIREKDFVYNPRISVTAPVGPVNCNNLNRPGVMSPLYTVFRVHDVDSTFLEYFFKSTSWHAYMYWNGNSGARSDRFSITDSIFMDMPILLPQKEEQEKIGVYFLKLYNAIGLHKQRLDKLKSLKKAFLEKMFV